MPPAAPNSSVAGCNVDQVIELSKRSKFFYEAAAPPRFANYRIEFRDRFAKVYFAIDRDTGNIFGAGAAWIKVYP
jgi:hypothetical protein